MLSCTNTINIYKTKLVCEVNNGSAAIVAYYNAICPSTFEGLEDVKEQIIEVKNEVDLIPGKIEEVKTEVDDTEAKLDLIPGKIEEVKTEVDVNEAKIDLIPGKIEEVNTEVQNVKEIVEDIKVRVSKIGKISLQAS